MKWLDAPRRLLTTSKATLFIRCSSFLIGRVLWLNQDKTLKIWDFPSMQRAGELIL